MSKNSANRRWRPLGRPSRDSVRWCMLSGGQRLCAAGWEEQAAGVIFPLKIKVGDETLSCPGTLLGCWGDLGTSVGVSESPWEVGQIERWNFGLAPPTSPRVHIANNGRILTGFAVLESWMCLVFRLGHYFSVGRELGKWLKEERGDPPPKKSEIFNFGSPAFRGISIRK